MGMCPSGGELRHNRHTSRHRGRETMTRKHPTKRTRRRIAKFFGKGKPRNQSRPQTKKRDHAISRIGLVR